MILREKHPLGVLFIYNRPMILGIDEAGRGPWAGPLVVGAVVLGGAQIEGLTDSKKLTKKKRELLYDEITNQALAYASGWVTAVELDDIGMGAALRLATRRAVQQITIPYSEIIIDGTVNFLADTGKGRYVQTMPKADLLVPSVSAASIIAKVERDRYMARLDEVYPGYGFGAHAGYGVARHREAIEQLGVTPEHRLSFAPLQKYRDPVSSATRISSAPVSARESRGTPRESRTAQPGRERANEMVSTDATASVTTKVLGDRAEEAVAEYLRREDHVILERNWRTKFCEIDIISRHDQTIYFTEVKYRKNAKYGDGLAAITSKKQRQMKFAAAVYLAHHTEGEAVVLAAASVTGEEFALENWVTLL